MLACFSRVIEIRTEVTSHNEKRLLRSIGRIGEILLWQSARVLCEAEAFVGLLRRWLMRHSNTTIPKSFSTRHMHTEKSGVPTLATLAVGCEMLRI